MAQVKIKLKADGVGEQFQDGVSENGAAQDVKLSREGHGQSITCRVAPRQLAAIASMQAAHNIAV